MYTEQYVRVCYSIKIFSLQKRDSEIARHMKEEHERAEEAEKQRDVERYKEQVRYQQELERQLEEQEYKKQQAYKEFLKEKLMIDEIVRKIYEEDQRLVQIMGIIRTVEIFLSYTKKTGIQHHIFN